MDLVLDQVMQLQHVDVADGHLAVEELAGAPVAQPLLAAARQSRSCQLTLDELLRRTVEHRRCDLESERVRRVAEVRFQHLAEVHAARHTERVEHDLDGGAVRQVRHVLDGHDPGDHTLVAVASRHLVALGDLSLLRDVDAHQLVDTGRQLVVALAAEHLDVHDDAALPVRDAQR